MDDFANFSPKKKSDQEWLDEANAVAQSAKGKNEAELLKEIYARAVEGKRNGTLTNEQIDTFYAQFSAVLDPVRRKRLKKLVDELKRM